ncbi:hypothetical protein EV196_104161 [Mariniflexile fucanivorans]|uniref:Uncharacterized protein n=1 Tax=Mariniflexile fucanivorans TaxID=264023 RepID=A0A4R1RJ36_9FLAO|nr:hypothetical protein [Mariniflexile fucanivorans]TCL66131.1 hypothetical protein EV196_104161 [Mariniflexile fucanivorans]
MKHFYLFFIFIISITVNGQTVCDDANYYLVSAYSHVKSSYDANNISHLKYYANRSVESLKLSKKPLTGCGCETALEFTDKAIILLAKVEDAKTYEDGRFFVKQGRDISKESVIAIEKCTAGTSTSSTANNQMLNDLEKEQLKLKQQQETLKLKEAEIKGKLAEQKEQEILLKKEQLILNYKTLIASNIKSYNETLKSCDCNHKTITNTDNLEDTSNKSIEDLKQYYVNNLKSLASNYLSELNSCN